MESTTKIIPEISNPITCKECKKTFKYKSKLIRHELVHNKIKKFACCYCSKTFSLSYNLKVHVRIHTGQKPYKCKYPGCNKSFVQSNNLKSHFKLHHISSTITPLPSYILEILRIKENKILSNEIDSFENSGYDSETTLDEVDYF